jgi:hypothetical protein
MEIEFVESVLENYGTVEITGLFSVLFDGIEAGVDEDVAAGRKSGRFDGMYGSVKGMMEESRASTRTQFSCF